MKCLFSSKIPVMQEKNSDEAAVLFVEHQEGFAFDFFYNAFAKDVQFTRKRKNHEKVKEGLVDKFYTKDHSKDIVNMTFEAGLDKQKSLNSITNTNRLYELEKPDQETDFKLFKNQLKCHDRLELFLL